MKRYRLTAVEAAAARRKPGYLAAVLAVARRDGDWLLLQDDQAQRLAQEFRLPHGSSATVTRPAGLPDLGNQAIWDAIKDQIRAFGDPVLYDLLLRHLQAWESGPTAAACSKCELRRARERLWLQCKQALNAQEPTLGTTPA
jgi:hypothetical protein